MPPRDLFVFRTMEEAKLRYPRHVRRPTDQVTSSCALGHHAHPVIGMRLQNVYLFAPISAAAERCIRAGQLGLREPRYYDVLDVKPALPGIQ